MGKVWQIAGPGGATGATWNSALRSLRRATPCFWHKDWPSPVQSTSATRDPGPPLISSISLSQSGFSFLQWPVKQKTMHAMHRMHMMHLPMSLAWAQHEFYCFTDGHSRHSVERSEVVLSSCRPHRTTGHRIWWRHSSLPFLPRRILQLSSNSQNQYQQIFQHQASRNIHCQADQKKWRNGRTRLLTHTQRHSHSLSPGRPSSSPEAITARKQHEIIMKGLPISR